MSLPHSAPVVLSVLAVGFAFPVAGCGGRAPTSEVTEDRRTVPDPWPAAVGELRKDTDQATCRRVLSQLGNDLSGNAAADQPVGLTPDGEKALAAFAHLTPDDLAEVRTPVYSALDAAYLSDCFYLRDAARSLELGTTDPAQKVHAAFAWVCRQVELRPWLIPVRPGAAAVAPPLPPVYVLRRGSGSELERAFVFLAVLQQLGIDGCLIGAANAQDGPAPESGTMKVAWPFWAVGARLGPDVLLFDPVAGAPIPGPDGKGTATLATLKPDGKPTAVFVSAPLSAMAPRMRLLEAKLKDEAPVRLALDPMATKAAFATDAKLADVRFWNPANDPFSYTRTLGSFLPADEGGKDTRPPGPHRLFDLYRRDQIPRSIFAIPSGVAPDVSTRLIGMFAGAYDAALLTSPTPREQIQRGDFQAATPALVQKRKAFLGAKERLRTDAKLEESLLKWMTDANAAYDRVARARLDKATNPAALSDAELSVDAFWRTNAAGTLALVDDAIAEPGTAETTYLLALCKHEQAERAQLRAEAARGAAATATGRAKDADDRTASAAADKARDAWAEARDWWGRYEPFAAGQNTGYPGRAAHARQLADRAATAAAK